MLIATAQAQVSINIRVNIAPSPLPYYEQPAIPAEGYTWVPGYGQAVSSAPPQGGSDVGQNRFDHMRVVGNAQLIGHGQQQRAGLGDSFVFPEMLD
jgi:hypothetical protein